MSNAVEACPQRYRDDQGRVVVGYCHPVREGNLPGDLTHDPVRSDCGDKARRHALVGVEVVAAVDVDGAAAVHDNLVQPAGQAAHIGVVDQRSVRLPPQQPLFRAGYHQQLTVGQPIDGEREGGRHLCHHLALPLQIERENLRAPQFDSHTRPSCQRADSPMTKSLASRCGSDMRSILSASYNDQRDA